MTRLPLLPTLQVAYNIATDQFYPTELANAYRMARMRGAQNLPHNPFWGVRP